MSNTVSQYPRDTLAEITVVNCHGALTVTYTDVGYFSFNFKSWANEQLTKALWARLSATQLPGNVTHPIELHGSIPYLQFLLEHAVFSCIPGFVSGGVCGPAKAEQLSPRSSTSTTNNLGSSRRCLAS